MQALRNPNLAFDHWAEIDSIVGQKIDVKDESFTLQDLILLDVVKHQEKIVNVSVQATGEYKLRLQLSDLYEVWKKVDFGTK